MYWLTQLAKNKIFLTITAMLLLGLVLTPALSPVLAVDGGEGEGEPVEDKYGLGGVSEGLGGSLGTAELPVVVGKIINVALSLLGVIAVVIVLIGGFKYMTAGGNEDQTAEARKWIFSGIIGLAIILSAWAITRFVFSSLETAITGEDLPELPE